MLDVLRVGRKARCTKLEEKLKEITSVTALLEAGDTPEMILEHILGEFGLEINDKLPTRFHCNCSKERVEKALISIGKKDIEEMITDGKPVSVNCHFCNTDYTFSVDELKAILKKARPV